jgi:hypothetical protein
LIFPLLNNDHWTVWCYKKADLKLYKYDSYKEARTKGHIVRSYIKDKLVLALDRGRTTSVDCPQQNNQVDCGFFALAFIFEICRLISTNMSITQLSSSVESEIPTLRVFINQVCDFFLRWHKDRSQIMRIFAPIWNKCLVLPNGSQLEETPPPPPQAEVSVETTPLSQPEISPESYTSLHDSAELLDQLSVKETLSLEQTHTEFSDDDYDYCRKFEKLNFTVIYESAHEYIDKKYEPTDQTVPSDRLTWTFEDKIKLVVIIGLRRLKVKQTKKHPKSGRPGYYLGIYEKSQFHSFKHNVLDKMPLFKDELNKKLDSVSLNTFKNSLPKLNYSGESSDHDMVDMHDMDVSVDHLDVDPNTDPKQHAPDLPIELLPIASKSMLLYLSRSQVKPDRIGVFARRDLTKNLEVDHFLPHDADHHCVESLPMPFGSFIGAIVTNSKDYNVLVQTSKIVCLKDMAAGTELVLSSIEMLSK